MSSSTRYAVDRDVVAALLAEWGEPRYRADQVWDALYRTMTPLEIRDSTAEAAARRARRRAPTRARPAHGVTEPRHV